MSERPPYCAVCMAADAVDNPHRASTQVAGTFLCGEHVTVMLSENEQRAVELVGSHVNARAL